MLFCDATVRRDWTLASGEDDKEEEEVRVAVEDTLVLVATTVGGREGWPRSVMKQGREGGRGSSPITEHEGWVTTADEEFEFDLLGLFEKAGGGIVGMGGESFIL